MELEPLLRLPKVLALTGYSRSRIYSLMAEGQFPSPVALGARAVAWPQRSIADWIASRTSKPQTRKAAASEVR